MDRETMREWRDQPVYLQIREAPGKYGHGMKRPIPRSVKVDEPFCERVAAILLKLEGRITKLENRARPRVSLGGSLVHSPLTRRRRGSS
jgi:hypothetical protein